MPLPIVAYGRGWGWGWGRGWGCTTNGALELDKAEDGTHLGVLTEWKQTKQQLVKRVNPNTLSEYDSILGYGFVCLLSYFDDCRRDWAKNTNWPVLGAGSGLGPCNGMDVENKARLSRGP